MNRFSIRGCRMDGTDIIWDDDKPEFFGVYELVDGLPMHHEDFLSRAEAREFIVTIRIRNAVQSERDKNRQLERENADLKLQLEKKVQLRTELEASLRELDCAALEVNLFNIEKQEKIVELWDLGEAVVLAYRTARDGDAL